MNKSLNSPNRLLASLRPTDFELLRPQLRPVELVHESVLFEAGDPIDRVYFPHIGHLFGGGFGGRSDDRSRHGWPR
jgi:hypothetical protein